MVKNKKRRRKLKKKAKNKREKKFKIKEIERLDRYQYGNRWREKVSEKELHSIAHSGHSKESHGNLVKGI